MKKVNLFKAEKGFSGEVARFMVCSLWRAEYKLELAEAVERELKAISGLKYARGSVGFTDEMADAAIAEREALIMSYKKAYDEVVSEWVHFKPHDSFKALYKEYQAGTLCEGLVKFFGLWGLAVSGDEDIIVDIIKAVSGDSARSNLRQVVQGGDWAVKQRTRSEFCTIVYRRLADYMLNAGTIRCVGNTVRGGGEDVAELLVEIPSLTRARYAKKGKK